jgi:hypothetical protein
LSGGIDTRPESPTSTPIPAPDRVPPSAAPALPSVRPSAADLSQRRRHALGEVTAELAAVGRADQPAVALRDYGPGCVCLGIAGPVGRARAERLQTLLGELRPRARRELIITVGGLGPWHPQLARVLAHARIQLLVDGAQVDLHNLPGPLAAQLGSAGPTTFQIEDGKHTTGPHCPQRPSPSGPTEASNRPNASLSRPRPSTARTGPPDPGTTPTDPGCGGTDRVRPTPRPGVPQPAPPAVLEMLARVLADLTCPARPWQIVAVAETYGADAHTMTRLHRLPAATYPSLGHIAHAYTSAHAQHGDPTRKPSPG